MYKILIIDDDIELCRLLKKSVMKEKVEADLCHRGKDVPDMLKACEYQLAVLDIMMPGMDGFETLQRIREKSNLPVLMLTAKDDNASKVRGLRAGADDYLTKPFEMSEFIARVMSLIRRYTRFNQKNGGNKQLRYEGLTIDIDRHGVIREGRFQVLPPKEFGVLLLCAENQGKILTKQQIYEAVWKEEYVYDDDNIMAVISRLRKKIEPNLSEPVFIQTIKGIGYQFNPEV